jgi:Fe-S cluster biogenesis protein NfuA
VHDVGSRHGRLGGSDAARALVPVERIGGRTDEVDVESTQPEPDGEIEQNPGAAADLTDEERGARLAALTSIIELMRPAVQADGGDLALISADVVTGVVEVQLQGACSSCAVSSSTLQGGVERILHDRLDWVTEVRGGVDESVDPFLSESMGRGGYVPSF